MDDESQQPAPAQRYVRECPFSDTYQAARPSAIGNRARARPGFSGRVLGANGDPALHAPTLRLQLREEWLFQVRDARLTAALGLEDTSRRLRQRGLADRPADPVAAR